MKTSFVTQSRKSQQRQLLHRFKNGRRQRVSQSLPAAAYRQRGRGDKHSTPFYAQEDWHEPTGREEIRFVVQPPGKGYIHPVTVEEVQQRLAELPERFARSVQVVQFSRMTRKRALFPCYGMQWGPNVYLYPMEDSLIETYIRPPRPEQLTEARMYGGQWTQHGKYWRLTWTPETIRDFYLNNVLIHEVGHVNDQRNSKFEDRERYANWFAIEYGYRPTREQSRPRST